MRLRKEDSWSQIGSVCVDVKDLVHQPLRVSMMDFEREWKNAADKPIGSTYFLVDIGHSSFVARNIKSPGGTVNTITRVACPIA